MSVQIDDLSFRYEGDRFELAIDTLSIDAAQPTAIIGPSGCGKTTLLRLIAGILRPYHGTVSVLGENISSMADEQTRAFRLLNIGLVFQEFELLEYLNTRDNILLPFRISHALALNDQARQRADDLAEATGIKHLLHARPAELSQGERQRVAICRALMTAPRLVLADEPTGCLDPENQRRMVELLRDTAMNAGVGLLMVTHDHALLSSFERVIDLPSITRDGEART